MAAMNSHMVLRRETARRQLEQLRKKLLDLTNRNRFLNFKHSETSRKQVRLINTSLTSLRDFLISQQKAPFRGIPDPQLISESADFKAAFERARLADGQYLEALFAGDNGGSQIDPEQLDFELAQRVRAQLGLPLKADREKVSIEEVAKEMGIDPSYELPMNGTADGRRNVFQTLIFNSKLDRKVGGLRDEFRGLLQELGINTLYCAFGFLEWYEIDHSDRRLLSPLLLHPMEMDRTLERGKYHFTGWGISEDTESNVTLAERLLADFGIKLPEFDENSSLEEYFDQIEHLIADKKRWRVVRYATVGIFNFSRLAMYKDLDPNLRPDDQKLEGHEVVADLLGGVEGTAEQTSEIYEPDAPEYRSAVPALVKDADSSQYSALVDACRGRNLVIEGPPGTGKSQTITNLIAAAMASGKTVLFVAEKLAALQVVKNRLDGVGLGDFCFELHSTKSRKTDVLESLRRRIQLENKPAPDVAGRIGKLEEYKSKIRAYLDVLHSRFGNSGQTLYDLIWAQQNARALVESYLSELSSTQIKDAEYFDEISIERTVRTFENLASVASDIRGTYGQVSRHPWFGVRDDGNTPDPQELARALQEARETLGSLALIASEVGAVVGYEESISVRDLAELQIAFERMGRTFERISSGELCQMLRGDTLRSMMQFLAALEELELSTQRFETAYARTVDSLRISFPDLEKSAQACKTYNLGALPLNKIEGRIDEALEEGSLWASLAKLTDHLFNLFEQEPLTIPRRPTALRALLAVTSTIAMTERGVLVARTSELCDESKFETLLAGGKKWHDLRKRREELLLEYKVDDLDAEELRLHAAHLNRAPFFWFLNADVRAAKRLFRGLARKPIRLSNQDAASALLQIADYLESVRAFSTDPALRAICGDGFIGIDSDFDLFLKVAGFAKQVREGFEHLGTVSRALGRWTLGAGMDDLEKIRLAAADTFYDDLVSKAREAETTDFASRAAAKRAESEDIGRLAKILQDLAFPETFDLSTLEGLVGEAISIFAIEDKVASNAAAKEVLGKAFAGAKTDKTVVAQLVECADAISAASIQLALQQAVATTFGDSRGQLCRLINESRGPVTAISDCIARLSSLGIDPSTFFPAPQWLDNTPPVLIARINYALSNAEALSEWVRYSKIRADARKLGAGDVLKVFDRSDCECDAAAAFKYAFFGSVIRAAFREHSQTLDYSGDDLTAVRRRFMDLDRELLQHYAAFVRGLLLRRAISAGNRVGPKSTLTDEALIWHEIGKSKRHIAIRDLIARAGTAIQQLKPCFMMSPLSVSQFIKWDSIKFDFVVIDEASQMRPEDAAGAISRGTQLVVVGDPKQLPPTTFFDRIEEFAEESDEDAEDSESILDLAQKQYHPARRLLWHYRSRHESLIAFSNHHFYNDELIVFPSPDSSGARTGLVYRHIDGRYRSSVNVIEAQALASAALRVMRDSPDSSLGIVAMNQPQRDLILLEVERLLTEDPRAADYVEHWESQLEPFFVKNLESVQGDERDVILISTVYGPDDSGNVMQRFGPINAKNGWRRLNVLFTRAKFRVEIFSSMRPIDIVVDEHTSRGARALRDYLEYAERGRLETGRVYDRQPQSDFEIAVAGILRNRGYEVVSQVGVAGYFIDLAVCHPRSSHTFVLGIECDGATYHRAKSARDRDRLREEVLRNFGWELYRIWSTDWFANPRQEIDKLIHHIEALLGTESSIRFDASPSSAQRSEE